MPQVQLPDRLYEQAQKLAGEAGFQNVDDYVADLVENDAAAIDHLFTPGVVAELEQICADMKSGGRTLSAEDVDDQLRRTSQAWRETPSR